MRITVLGCTGGVAADLRTTCLMLDDDILIDVGTGAGDLTLTEMLCINTVFLTHSHLDHAGLLPMVADMVGPRRNSPVTVYALPETIAVLKQDMFNFRLWPDYTRLPAPDNPYIVFQPVAVGETVELSGRKVTPLPVRHAVPGVGYQLDSGKASFVFSGDTTYHEPFWTALNAIGNLRYLMIETTFLNHNRAGAEAAGHMRPELLAQGLKQLNKAVRLLVTHMEPGNEDATMAEIQAAAGEFKPERLRRGQVFEF
ncbi:3',5'-cyclic-nucleotide phosphodiesterase [Nitrosovibrio sp. Nv6]|uniref:3',5'-cyclic-nucleotide phosphodiesterase n=1 Tax=Nitrosovibrio sp. Nv6 TaxID=1855340 RepID=UPI0008B55A42|nr:3',5'-cyclic-nucleotide phosphodiesterase [Nitrosovibrio sp. Nv6]SEP05899.1 Ribonuclease BN, tRNA processing enzyme [Nitrosovibrio sp. Nv6]